MESKFGKEGDCRILSGEISLTARYKGLFLMRET